MIAKPELIKKIKAYFDLNIYETKVWIALISKGIASAGEIAEMSGVPRSRTYDVLESLEKRGFAIAKIGKPVKYLAVKPTIIVEKLKNDTVTNANEKVKMISSLKETKEYTELESLYKTGVEPTNRAEMSASIKGKTNIYSHVREMLENSEKEAIICMPAADLENKSRIFSEVFSRLKKAGIKLLLSLSGDENEISRIEKKMNIKAERININAKFFISDRKQVLFVTNNSPNEEEIGVWLDSDFFSSSLGYLFELAMRKK
jgi:sugar-specific transcriptional regulator TrmB